MNVSITPETLFVTGSHRVRTDESPESPWTPPGAHHARRAGEAWTRCGLTAVEWPIFWELQFSADNPLACVACAVQVSSSERPHNQEVASCG
jgi:hypothetical protein